MPRARMAAAARVAAAAALAAAAVACATVAPLTLPAGPWAAEPGGADLLARATSACRGVRTLTAEIAIRGQVGSQKIRGRVIAGFERGGSARLEAPAPFGAPVFVLSARANRATLWLPRDGRIVRDAPVEDVLEAIAGLRRSSDDLLGLLAGCLAGTAPAASGGAERGPSGWMRVPLQDAAVAFLRFDKSAWRLAAGYRGATATEPAWQVAYEGFTSAFPDVVRISRTPGPAPQPGVQSTLNLQVSQRETNVDIDARAFDPLAAPGATPMTLDELRQAGPLADRASLSETGR